MRPVVEEESKPGQRGQCCWKKEKKTHKKRGGAEAVGGGKPIRGKFKTRNVWQKKGKNKTVPHTYK